MKTLVLTGGIATGKSTACGFLPGRPEGCWLFESDATVRRLLDHDAAVAVQVVAVFGARGLTADGRVDRAFIRQRVFADAAERLRLEAILHPRVREECLALREDAGKRGARWFVADVPLFFETAFDLGQDQVLVVGSSRATQISRLKARSGFDDSMIDAILAAQLLISDKMSRADVVFWNEGPPAMLETQVKRFFH